MLNKKYQATDKNGGDIPSMPITGYTQGNDLVGTNKQIPIYDDRVGEIMIPCGQCIECRQTKAREWQVRIGEEIKDHDYNYFITLTFSPKELQNILFKLHLDECNAVAAYALRHCLERYRKDAKRALNTGLLQS